jgi:cytochrome c peroxidase
MINKKIVLVILIFVALSMVIAASTLAQDGLTPIEELGQFLYFDKNLSDPAGQSCASCHDPEFAFVDPDSNIPVSEGIISGLFGGRNSPMSAYAMYAPIFHFDEDEGLWFGGQFWDGRATGNIDFTPPGMEPSLGDALADQARGPFLNPVEMANTSKSQVIDKIKDSEYVSLFNQVCGAELTVEAKYDCMALAIAAFERTGLFGQFTSKYDYYLQTCLLRQGDPVDCAVGVGNKATNAGLLIFTDEEWRGLQLFMDGEEGGAKCVLCHVADWVPVPVDDGLNVYVPDWAPEGLAPPVFTDFSFDNLGVPQNREWPLDPTADPDLGLGPIVEDEEENGKFKVMPLRNIADTKPYAHNGFFRSLKDITHFYNTRDIETWAPPEYPDTVNEDELGNLGLSDADEDALVAFMKTLSDGYMP